VNLGWIHHPIHLQRQSIRHHRHGGRPRAAVDLAPANTVLVGVAQARVVEFEAKYPGDWMIHCHCRIT